MANYPVSFISALPIFFLAFRLISPPMRFLTHMMAHVTGLKVGDFVHSLGDAHLYMNHLDQARLQLERKPGPLPQLELINPPDELTDFRFEHIQLSGYEAAPSISAPIAV